MTRRWLTGAVAWVLAGSLTAQAQEAASPGRFVWQVPRDGGLLSGYRSPQVEPVKLQDRLRLQSLVRDGKIYLSLRDAISLALQNSLDLELERDGMRLAESDVLRSQAGLLPQGVPLSVREGPGGLGAPVIGPNGTLGGGDAPGLNSLIGPGVQVDLSILGSVPLPTGSAIPNFDPQITAAVSGSHISSPQNSTFLPGILSLSGNNLLANVGYEQGFTSGGNLNVFFNSERLDQFNPLAIYNPAISSTVGISFTEPLLRGFGLATNRRYIRISANNRRISDAVFVQQLIATTYGIVRLYWDLQSLKGDERVRADAVASARQFLEDSRNRLETGTFAQVDVTQAEAELSRRQRDFSVAHSLVRQQEATVIDYLTRGPIDGEIASAAIEPTDPLPQPSPVSGLSVDQLYAEALRNRPEVIQANLQLANSTLSLRGSENEIKPQLDVVASAENSSLAGPIEQGGPGDPLLTGGYGSALTQLVHNNFPSYSVGIQLALPLRNREARSDVLRDAISVRQQQIRIRQLQKQIRLEVNNAAIALDEARETCTATRSERIFQEQEFDTDQQKLEVGASNSYSVIRDLRDVAAARSAEISALANYQKAEAALERVTGSILDDHQIDFDKGFQPSAQKASRP